MSQIYNLCPDISQTPDIHKNLFSNTQETICHNVHNVNLMASITSIPKRVKHLAWKPHWSRHQWTKFTRIDYLDKFSMVIWFTSSNLKLPNLITRLICSQNIDIFLMQDMPIFVSLFLVWFLDMYLDSVRWFQSDVAPLLPGLQLFESNGQDTEASHFLLMSTTLSIDRAGWGMGICNCDYKSDLAWLWCVIVKLGIWDISQDPRTCITYSRKHNWILASTCAVTKTYHSIHKIRSWRCSFNKCLLSHHSMHLDLESGQ